MRAKPSVDIVLPVYHGNAPELESSVTRQLLFYTSHLKAYDWSIIISVNGDLQDGILSIAKKLSKKDRRVKCLSTPISGKGAGVLNGWKMSRADIMVYMDIDLAVKLDCIIDLLHNIEQGYDLCVGSRYHPLSKTTRSLKRKIISTVYHLFFLKAMLRTTYDDAHCGFKAISRQAARAILPLVKDRQWFFESELLYIAQKKGMSIAQIPVIWKEGRFSSLNLLRVIPEFIVKTIALRFRRLDKN